MWSLNRTSLFYPLQSLRMCVALLTHHYGVHRDCFLAECKVNGLTDKEHAEPLKTLSSRILYHLFPERDIRVTGNIIQVEDAAGYCKTDLFLMEVNKTGKRLN